MFLMNSRGSDGDKVVEVWCVLRSTRAGWIDVDVE